MSDSTKLSLIRILLILAAFAACTASLLASFRLGWDQPLLSFRANYAQTAAAIAAAIAFGVAGASSYRLQQIQIHLTGYTSLILVIAIFSIGLSLDWPLVLMLLSVLVLLPSVLFANRMLLGSTNFIGVLSGLWLVLWLLVSVLAYGFSLTLDSNVGNLFLWLQGDISASLNTSVVLLLVVLILATWVCTAANEQPIYRTTSAHIVLLAIGIGTAGPMFFLSYLAPQIAWRIAPGTSKAVFSVMSACVAIILVIVAELGARVYFGGYAPPLIISFSILAIPLVVWFLYEQSVQTATVTVASRLNKLFILLGTVSFFALIFLIAKYVHSAS